jgi:outer membrane protein, heavy metal efflux system
MARRFAALPASEVLMHRIIVLTGLVLSAALRAAGQAPPVVLTYEDALARARSAAPAIVAARMRVEETRGRVLGASLPFSTNPAIGGEGGRRGGAGSSTDFSVDIAQELDLPARRRARIEAARAFVAREEQQAGESERQVLREVATSYVLALEARERAEAAGSGTQLAGEALRIAERRYAAGDVARLDVNLARTVVARAEAEARAATATLAGHATHLQVLLGITAPVTIGGSLRDVQTLPTDDLPARAAERSDVRALDAEIAEAEAEQRIARTLRWPDFGLRASYAREGEERVVLGGVGMSLPLFNRGQEASAVASARLARLRVEREALTRTVEAEVRGAMAAHDALRGAAAEYERSVLPLVEENERLALESYDVGQIGLADLLLVRRESLDARRTFIDQLTELRLAEVELTALAGAWK